MFVEVGDQLTKIFLNTPNEFMKAMADTPQSFEAWLEGLETISFTNFNAVGKAEDSMEIAKMEKLKEMMLERCNLLKGTSFVERAEKIEDRLQKIVTRNIQ